MLTGEECCLLQKAFIKDVCSVLQEVETECDIIVYYVPDGDLKELKELLPGVSTFLPQNGGSLGMRMLGAISETLAARYKSCLLIGSDLPLLKPGTIDEAFALLGNHDIVICPTMDGGFYLIGMKEPFAEVFDVELYGVSTVFDKTISAAEKCGKSYAVGAASMDIDEPADLRRLIQTLETESPGTCPETRKALKSLTVEW